MPSFSRPRVCNDNVYAESLLRTCKDRPNYPSKPFASVDEVRRWTLSFVPQYNHQPKHSTAAPGALICLPTFATNATENEDYTRLFAKRPILHHLTRCIGS